MAEGFEELAEKIKDAFPLDIEDALREIVWEARREGVRIAVEWLEVREEHESGDLPGLHRLKYDAGHSLRGGLLDWMIRGNEPLEQPPPRFMSRPWHDVVDSGEAVVDEVAVNFWEADDTLFLDFDHVDIGQYPWRILETVEPNDVYLVSWRREWEEGDPLWELSRTTYGAARYLPEEDRSERYEAEGWKLRRLDASAHDLNRKDA